MIPLFVIILISGVVGIVAFNQQNKSEQVPTPAIINELTPTLVSPTPTSAPSKQNIPLSEIKIESKKGEVKIEAEEGTLTTIINQTLTGTSLGETPFGEAKISSVKVELQSGVIKISGDAAAGAINLPVEAAARVNLVDKKPKVSVENARVGIISLPSIISSQLEKPLQTQVDNLLKDKDIEIKSIVIENGKLTILGTEN